MVSGREGERLLEMFASILMGCVLFYKNKEHHEYGAEYTRLVVYLEVSLTQRFYLLAGPITTELSIRSPYSLAVASAYSGSVIH